MLVAEYKEHSFCSGFEDPFLSTAVRGVPENAAVQLLDQYYITPEGYCATHFVGTDGDPRACGLRRSMQESERPAGVR